MKLIAKRPCSFGGRNFFIDEEIPAELVADVKLQEKLGILTVIADTVPDEDNSREYESAVAVTVYGDGDSDTALLLSPEEVQSVFAILQQTAEAGVKAIAEVKSENVLILVHAVDSRKTIKDAAKKQADNLFSTKDDLNEASTRNEATDTNPEGDDT